MAEPILKRFPSIKGIEGILIQTFRFLPEERDDYSVRPRKIANPEINYLVRDFAILAFGSSRPCACEE